MTMQATDIAQNKDLIYATVMAVAMGAGTLVNLAILDRTKKHRISEKVWREDNSYLEHKLDLAALRGYEAARLIELGMQIMSAAQVNRWEGVREWLMLNAGHSGPYADDKGENGAGIEEPANAIFEAGGSTDPSYGADAMGGEKSLSGRKSSPFVARQQPFSLRNADADLTHPGYPPEYNLTPAEIAERLRVGILDLEEPGDADAGFPDWEPKARPF